MPTFKVADTTPDPKVLDWLSSRLTTFSDMVFQEIKDNFQFSGFEPKDKDKEPKDKEPNPKLVAGSEKSSKLMPVPFSHGLIGTVSMAYNQHLNLELRPDDIWLAITLALTRYIDSNSETLRSKFVSFQGKKDLSVQVNNPIEGISKLVDLIDAETGDWGSWMTANFSTTTPTDRTTSKAICMSAMGKYFNYSMMASCGIPNVSLLGTREDWQLIYDKCQRLTELGAQASQWHPVLCHVLSKFLETFDGQFDLDFWSRIISYEKLGSGSALLTGWIVAFVPWDNKGNYVLRELSLILVDHVYAQLDTERVPSGRVQCTFGLIFGEKTIKCILESGLVGVDFNAETKTVCARSDFLIYSLD